MKNTFFIFSILLGLISCEVSQNSTSTDLTKSKKWPKDGNCYARCSQATKLEFTEEKYLVFTGTVTDSTDGIYWVEDVLSPESTKWIKKKADKNCQSADPNDCLVWCLVGVPARVIRYYSVDIDLTDQYVKSPLPIIDQYTGPSGLPSTQIICPKEQYLWEKQIRSKLIEMNYLSDDISGTHLDPVRFHRALFQYQKENQLCAAGITLETLEAMGLPGENED